jgi:outer membrane immunogenic protein
MRPLKSIVSAAVAIVGVSAASAADMAAKAPMRAAPVAYAPSWTGCYVGGGGGYGLWKQENTAFNDGPPRTPLTETWTNGGSGYFGTVQGGCDYQFGLGSYNLVVGAFGDYDFASLKGRMIIPGFDIVGNEKMSSAWSVGGRVGWLVTPSLLTYFSGGYTEATFDRVDYHNVLLPPGPGVIVIAPPPAPPALFIDKRTYKGWFLGAGDEYALGFLPGLFWKTEYRFSHFDTENIPFRFAATGAQAFGDSLDSRKWVHTVRSELVYRFNWGGPVVAKY